LTQKQGTLSLQGGQPSLQVESTAQAIRPANPSVTIDRRELLTVLSEGEARPLTLLAHDGRQGRIVSGLGGLSFRAGDFFAGKDVEHMRLTAEGNLGLGVEQPQAKLDVAGTIRTSEGIVFPDGTIQTTAARVGVERVGVERKVADRSIEVKDGNSSH